MPTRVLCRGLDYVEAKEGEHVLDFCAGSGGKTLAFAPKTKQKGKIYLYDIRPFMLKQAKIRLRRAGIQNAQILDKKHEKKEVCIKKCIEFCLTFPTVAVGLCAASLI